MTARQAIPDMSRLGRELFPVARVFVGWPRRRTERTAGREAVHTHCRTHRPACSVISVERFPRDNRPQDGWIVNLRANGA